MLIGVMYYPWNWSDKKQVQPERGMAGSKWSAKYKLSGIRLCSGGNCHPAMREGRTTDWFTNYTWISTDQSRPWWRRTPWQRPGFAPIYGEGCGANGGWYQWLLNLVTLSSVKHIGHSTSVAYL